MFKLISCFTVWCDGLLFNWVSVEFIILYFCKPSIFNPFQKAKVYIVFLFASSCLYFYVFSIKNDVLKTFFMTKTYRKLCFYDKKQTHLKMAHVASCRFVYIKRRCLKRMPSFFCHAALLLSIFIFKTSLVFSIIPLREVILQK